MKYHTISFFTVELEPENYHILVKAKVDKHILLLIIDTGASHTCFDYEILKLLAQGEKIERYEGLAVGISETGFDSSVSKVKNLQFGKLTIPEYEIIALDLQHINNIYAQFNYPKIDGILGSDFLLRYDAVINFKTKKLRLCQQV